MILRWHLQHGNIIFPKATNPQHTRGNINILNFALTPAETAVIDALDRNKHYFTYSVGQQIQAVSHLIPAG